MNIGDRVVLTHSEIIVVRGRFKTIPVGSTGVLRAFEEGDYDEPRGVAVVFDKFPKYRVWTSIDYVEPIPSEVA